MFGVEECQLLAMFERQIEIRLGTITVLATVNCNVFRFYNDKKDKHLQKEGASLW